MSRETEAVASLPSIIPREPLGGYRAPTEGRRPCTCIVSFQLRDGAALIPILQTKKLRIPVVHQFAMSTLRIGV